MSGDPIQLAEAEEERAVQALRELEEAIRVEKRDAMALIDAKHSDELRRLKGQRSAARRAVIAAKDAHLPDHPWSGKRVHKMKRVGSLRHGREERIEGVVETVRSSTEFPLNTASYSKPRQGKAIVRLLTTKGAVGLRFEKLDRGAWKLVEEPSNG
jgi:hypothetical protein